jgi:transposase-like protein
MDERVFVHWFSFGEPEMPRSYSGDLREQVTEAVQTEASRREAAKRFEISANSAVR